MAIMSPTPAHSATVLAMPLVAPSPEAAWEFLQWAVPESVFSSGSGRRRRGRITAERIQHRSDQGFLVFYRAPGPDQPIQQRPLKSPAAIQGYLKAQTEAPPADHWIAFQSTQFRARRDGRTLQEGFTADRTRHLLSLVVDLDGSRMDPFYLQLLTGNWYAFAGALDELLGAIGVEAYRLVRTGPTGVHIHVPLIRPDGRPLRSTPKNLDIWEKVARGLNRHLSRLGADANAVRITQPFTVPGLERAKHPGFIPYVAGGRDGARANLYHLLRRLADLGAVYRREAVATPLLSPSEGPGGIPELLEEVRERAVGVGSGERNQTAHDLATYLLAKGARPDDVWPVLQAWNRRNSPPLSEVELRGCLRSAQRCADRHPGKWAEMRQAPWNRLRGQLGLPAVATRGYRRGGRWRPLTPAKSWEERKASGGREHFAEVEERVLRLVAGEGGNLELTQEEICDRIDTNRSTLRAVLRRLEASGRLLVSTRRGRGGQTSLALPQAREEGISDMVVNGQSRNSTFGVKPGVWVGSGSGERVEPPLGQVSWAVKRLAPDLQLVGCVVLVGPVSRWRLIALSPAGRRSLRGLLSRGLVPALEDLLGCRLVVDIGVYGVDGLRD